MYTIACCNMFWLHVLNPDYSVFTRLVCILQGWYISPIYIPGLILLHRQSRDELQIVIRHDLSIILFTNICL